MDDIKKSRTLSKYDFKVHPKGIEPLSEVPETSILSIELQVLMQSDHIRKSLYPFNNKAILSECNGKSIKKVLIFLMILLFL